MAGRLAAWALIAALCVAPVLAGESSTQSDDPPTDAGQEEQESKPPKIDKREYVEVNLSKVPSQNTVTTKLPIDPLFTPANVGTVGQALIEEQDDVMLSGALRNVSGVNVQTQSMVHDYFLIRGFDSVSSGLIMTDGTAEPEATFYNTYNVEAIEVLKGPASFLYGLNNPLGGAVNIVRKQPLPTTFGRLFASTGSFDTHRVLVDWNLASKGGGFGFRINTLWMETQGYRDRTGGDQLAVNPSFGWTWGEKATLVFNLEFARSDFLPDPGLPIVGDQVAEVPRETNYGSPADTSLQDIGRFQVDFEYRFSDKIKLRNKTYYRGLDWQTNGTLILGTGDFGFGELVFRNLTMLDNRQRFGGNQLEGVFQARTGTVEHTLLVGLEAARLENDFTLDLAQLPPVMLQDPMETASGPLMPIPFAAGQATTDVLAPYVIDEMKVSRRFHVLLGARWSRFDFEDQVSATQRTDDDVSPWLGLVWAPDESLSVYANAGSSFFPADPRVVGPREPETGDQLELGLKKRFLDGRLQSTLAVYDIQRTNIAIPDDNGFTQQTGDQGSRGVEFDLAAEPLRGLRTFVGYAYNDSTLTRFSEIVIVGPAPTDFIVVDRSGNRPAFTPEHLLNFWIGKTFDGGFGVAGGVRFTSEQFIDEDNEYVIDGYQVVDAMVFYDFGDYRLNLNVKNLLDEDYQMRGFGTSSVIPGPPLAAFVGFEFKR